MSNDKKYDDVLEENVSNLLEGSNDAPKLDDITRAKMRNALIAKHGVATTSPAKQSARKPLFAVGLGLAAAAAGAAIIARGGSRGTTDGTDEPTGTIATETGKLDDGSTWIVEGSSKVTTIGPRHVRVTGAALLDVVPGKGVFTVETEQGTIEVLGTKFLVDADANRTTTAVVRGSVKLATSEGNVVLHAGEQGIAEHAKPPTRGPAPRLSHLVSWAAQARHKAEGKSIEPLHHGTLFAKDPGVRSHPPWGEEYPLPMKQLKVDVVVENQVARVALDQTFHNNEDQALEGTYRFAIPPDAALQRLAMYVDGNLMESAVVERMAARKIYEELVYRRVDPALLEWAGTGRLNLRVYPIPARQDKRIMLAYTQSLPKLYDDWTVTVPFPEIDAAVGDVSFDVRIKDCKACELSSTSHQIESKVDGNDAIVTYHHTGEKIGDSLVIHVRDAHPQASVATTGSGDERYMMVRAPSNLTGDAKPYKPRTWVILDDVSASRGPMERKAQNDLVESFFEELDEEDRVAVVAFDVEARKILAPTRVLDVDHKAVRKALEAEGGVGATDFAAALDTATTMLAGVAPDDAMVVYLGDGVITSGTRKLDELRARLVVGSTPRAHFIGVGVGDGPDTQTMDALANATGGFSTTIDLADDVSWRAFDLVAALHTARATGVEAKLVDDKGTMVPATLYLRTPQVADGEEVELVAKLAGSGTPVAAVVTGMRDGKEWTQRIELANATKPSGTADYLPRLWAQRHVAARLLAKHEAVTMTPCADAKPAACKTEAQVRADRDEAIRQDVVALGKKYFLLSRHTSLLVLENDAMYAQYGVTKGAGDTWAPYAMPAKIPVVIDTAKTQVASTTNVAPQAEVVRAPLAYFYDYSAYYGWRDDMNFEDEWGGADLRTRDRSGWDGDLQRRAAAGPFQSRMDLGLAQPVAGAVDTVTAAVTTPTMPTEQKLAKADKAQNEVGAEADASERQQMAGDAKQQMVLNLDDGRYGVGNGRGVGSIGHAHMAFGQGAGGMIGGGTFGRYGYGYGYQMMQLARLQSPADQAYDDLATWIPALVRDGFNQWRERLTAGGGDKPHTIDAAAKDLLARAHGSLPAGVYQWNDFEIAVDAQHHLGWRRITDAALHETASFDGTTWTRRYAELGLDATRTIGDDAVALYFAYMPLLVATPEQYARWYDVTATGKVVKLSVKGKLAYTLELDDQARLVAIGDADGKKLVEIAWGSSGPMAAKILGKTVTLGYSAQPIADAGSWAHQAAPVQPVIVELPVHLVAYAQDQVKAQTAGTPAWVHAQHQLMASYLAVQNRGSLAQVYRDLQAKAQPNLGELVLAAPGLATNTSDKEFADALAPFGTKPDRTVVARYLMASRAWAKDNKAADFAHPTEGGLVAQLFTLREVAAKAYAGQGKAAVDALLKLDGKATDLRTVAAALVTQRYEIKAEDIARAWEAAATGSMKNIARAQAAMAMWNRGAYDAGSERIAQLVADLDLTALPPQLDQAPSLFYSSRRGQAGWQLVWASWRDKVLASGDYDHVMSLIGPAQNNPTDLQAIINRAAALSGDDADRRVALAEIALQRAQPALAQSLIDPMIKAHPTHDLYMLAARMSQAQGRMLDALNALESAQAVAGDEAVDVNTVRSELGQIIAVAKQLAVQSTGTQRDSAVERAMTWGTKWRAIDQGNPAIDQMLGDLLLAVGDAKGAWRQLSTVIERNPMAGDGYMTVADTFERQGKVTEALEFWQQALVIDQTNPTPRFRKAQALIAVGRTAEGDALLKDVANGKWHETWSGVVYQAKSLLERGK